MTPDCPKASELVQLLDGEITENRANQLHQHFDVCNSCRDELFRQRQLLVDIAAPLPGIPGPALALRIAEQTVDAPMRPGRRALSRASTVAAACVGVLLLALTGQRLLRSNSDAFRARGGTTLVLSRYVGVTLARPDRGMQPLRSGATVEPGAAYVMTYRNLRTGPVYLLCFAVDADQTVHWLYPAYLDPDQDPISLALPPTREEIPLPESVVLDRPVAGELRFITILSTVPERVSSIERLGPRELQTPALQARFPGAVVGELSVTVTEAP